MKEKCPLITSNAASFPGNLICILNPKKEFFSRERIFIQAYENGEFDRPSEITKSKIKFVVKREERKKIWKHCSKYTERLETYI